MDRHSGDGDTDFHSNWSMGRMLWCKTLTKDSGNFDMIKKQYGWMVMFLTPLLGTNVKVVGLIILSPFDNNKYGFPCLGLKKSDDHRVSVILAKYTEHLNTFASNKDHLHLSKWWCPCPLKPWIPSSVPRRKMGPTLDLQKEKRRIFNDCSTRKVLAF